MPVGPLYKYLRPEHAVGLVRRGEALIGTLYGYRSQEAVGLARVDDQEGYARQYDEIGSMLVRDTSDLPPTARLLPIEMHNVEIVSSDGAKLGFEFRRRSENHFIYCMSKVFDEHLLRKFGGACVRIDDVERFVNTMAHLLGSQIQSFVVADCLYRNDRTHTGYEKPIHPVQLKDTSFAEEQEVRAIFVPPIGNERARKVRSLRLASCCVVERMLPRAEIPDTGGK